MFCGECGKSNIDGVKFCVHCGADFTQLTPPASGDTLDASAAEPPRKARGPADTLDAGATIFAGQLRAGKVLAGQYQIVGDEPLGSGGMGEVWQAEDTELGTTVAIKVLPPVLARDKAAIAALKREATIGRQLTHANICRLYSFHSDGEMKFIVMEYVDGKTLAEVLAEHEDGRLTWDELAPIAAQVAEALDYAHGVSYADPAGRQVAGVLHRDIKPQNIMVTPAGRVKLMDFGIAREIRDTMRVTGRTSQTPLYASPEQFRGQPMTTASDIYSFTAVLYECLAGRPMISAHGDMAWQILEKPFEQLHAQTDAVNEALAAGLSREPTKRPAAAVKLVEAFSATVTRIVGSPPVSKRVAGKPVRNISTPEPSAGAPVQPVPVAATKAMPASRHWLVRLVRTKLTWRTRMKVLLLIFGFSGLIGATAFVAYIGWTESHGARWEPRPIITRETAAEAEQDADGGRTSSEQPTEQASEFVNVRCPVIGTEIDSTNVPDYLVRMHRGRKVAFCCWLCLAAWDVLTDAERDAKLAQSTGDRGGTSSSPPPSAPVTRQIRAPIVYTDWPFASTEAARRQAETAQRLGVDKYMTINLGGGVTMRLVLIPAGEFVMGSPSTESARDDDEGPQHRVRISKPFYVGVYEVTQDQYKAVTGGNPSKFTNAGGSVPVGGVSWAGASSFCRELSTRTGRRVRLPTEAEWEYACRAGTDTALNSGRALTSTNGACRNLDAVGWYYENSDSKPHPVGQKAANAFGLHDMHGNVYEWCGDKYGRDYYATFANAKAIDPQGPTSGYARVLRGASWSYGAKNCRSANRLGNEPGRHFIGFRVVVDLK